MDCVLSCITTMNLLLCHPIAIGSLVRPVILLIIMQAYITLLNIFLLKEGFTQRTQNSKGRNEKNTLCFACRRLILLRINLTDDDDSSPAWAEGFSKQFIADNESYKIMFHFQRFYFSTTYIAHSLIYLQPINNIHVSAFN